MHETLGPIVTAPLAVGQQFFWPLQSVKVTWVAFGLGSSPESTSTTGAGCESLDEWHARQVHAAVRAIRTRVERMQRVYRVFGGIPNQSQLRLRRAVAG